eukprot:Sdes_comp20252_c0_seq1m13705
MEKLDENRKSLNAAGFSQAESLEFSEASDSSYPRFNVSLIQSPNDNFSLSASVPFDIHFTGIQPILNFFILFLLSFSLCLFLIIFSLITFGRALPAVHSTSSLDAEMWKELMLHSDTLSDILAAYCRSGACL